MAVPNTFTNGTIADADEINDNFDYITNLLEPLNTNGIRVKSAFQSIATTGSTNNSITGTAANIIDFDITTFYQNSSSWTGGISGSNAYIIIDYGAVIWNATVFTRYYLTSSGGGSGSYKISFSQDGSNWTELTCTADSDNFEQCYNIMRFRYLRFVALRTTSSSANNATVKLYECQVIGL